MSRLDELIQEYCPDGVEYKTLGELGTFFGGLTGKKKDDFIGGNAKFITYKNVYDNPSLRFDLEDKVRIKEGEKQRTLEYGDVVFTGSSETPDECGISSVVTQHPSEPMYLNSFCFILRFHKLDIILPDFAKHLFRSESLRYQLGKTASGVTRYNVSKEKMKGISIPVPPLPVQEEIVRILDNFTELTAELQAELQARKKQYEYYREKLIQSNDNVSVLLSDVAQYAKERISTNRLTKYNYVGVDNLLQNKAGKKHSEHLPTEGNVIAFNKGDVLIGNIRPYLKKIWFADCEGGTNGDVLTIRIKDPRKLIPRYLYHVLASDDFFNYDTNNSKGAKMPRGDKDAVMRYRFSLPNLEKQREIISILDRFDTLCNDLASGLPAEIEARQKQYEYYRDKLLDFKPLS